MEQNNAALGKHSLFIDNRKSISLTGVTEIVSFDENEIRFSLADTDLVVEGDFLKIEGFSKDTGQVSVCGSISSVIYCEKQKEIIRRGLLGRLFSHDGE